MFTFPVGMVAPAGGISNPLDIPDCVVWLRSDLGVTDVSSAVSAWANQGSLGSAGDASQSSAPSRPAYASNGGLNNRAKLTFSSSNLDWAYDGTGAKTLMVVLKLASTPGTGFTIYEVYNSAPVVSEILVDLATYAPVSFVDDWTAPTYLSGIADSLGSSVGHAFIHTFDGIDPASTSSYGANLDGTTKTVIGSQAYGSPAAASHIGGRLPSGTFMLDGDMYEIVIYNRVLNGSEISELAAYAVTRYAL